MGGQRAFALIVFSFIFINLVSATTTYNEDFLTNNQYTLSNIPITIDRLFTYNHTWLNFDGVGDYVRLSNSTIINPVFSNWREVDNKTSTLKFHQGLARSPTNIYLFDSGVIHKAYFNFTSIQNTTYLPTNTNHNSEPDYRDGKLYYPAEYWSSCDNYNNQTIVIMNATNLAAIQEFDISANNHEVSGISINDDGAYAYVTDFCNSTHIFR